MIKTVALTLPPASQQVHTLRPTNQRLGPLNLSLLQVILDLKGSDFSYSYQTPPASPSNTLSRKGSVSRYTHTLQL